MMTISIEDLPSRVRRQLEQLKPGETASIMRGNAQVAELTAMPPQETELRPDGQCEGQFVVPDSFFDPLPDDILRAFEGRE
jgi:antitoxin (DNA-binding transcriptional repressor) of toxin-antitoxin stability system